MLSESWGRRLRQWFIPSSSGVHFDVADGLRGVAILLVVVYHGFYANPNGSTFSRFLSRCFEMGWMGVPIFFALSAFLLSLPFFRRREDDSAFWRMNGFGWRRALKIVPPYFLSIALLTAFSWARSHDTSCFRAALANASGWTHLAGVPAYLNPSYWSLWVEIGFYVTLPLAFLACCGQSAGRTAWILLIVYTAAPIAIRSVLWPSNSGDWLYHLARFPNSLDCFGWGLFFAYIYSRLARNPSGARSLARLGWLGIALLILAGWTVELRGEGVTWPTRTDVAIRNCFPGIASFFMLFFVFDAQSVAARVLSSPALRFLGIVSYEWFLLHQPLQTFARSWVGNAHGRIGAYLSATVAPSLAALARRPRAFGPRVLFLLAAHYALGTSTSRSFQSKAMRKRGRGYLRFPLSASVERVLSTHRAPTREDPLLTQDLAGPFGA